MSFAMTEAMSGRSTFTATGVPSKSSAKCTCATEALAIGVRSKELNTASTGLPYRRARVASTCSDGNGGTLSCSFASSSAMSARIRSRRVDSICPNLTKIGPKSWSSRRKRSPRGADVSRQKVSARAAGRTARKRSWPVRNSSSPYFSATKMILARRRRRILSIVRETLSASRRPAADDDDLGTNVA